MRASTPATLAPRGSVRIPVRIAGVGDCPSTRHGTPAKINKPKGRPKESHRREVLTGASSPGFARELKVAAYPGSFPAFAVARSVGLLAWRHASRGLPIPTARDSGLRGTSPPYSRAAAAVFHRLPGTDLAGDVAEPCGGLPIRAARLRVNDNARPGIAGTLCTKPMLSRGAAGRGR